MIFRKHIEKLVSHEPYKLIKIVRRSRFRGGDIYALRKLHPLTIHLFLLTRYRRLILLNAQIPQNILLMVITNGDDISPYFNDDRATRVANQ